MPHIKKTKKSKKTGRYEDQIEGALIRARNPVTIRRFVLTTNGVISSNGAGVISGNIPMDPSGSSQWSSVALLYDQFRVLGGQISLVSIPANASAATNTLVRWAFDNDSTVTPTSYADIAGYSEVTSVPACWTGGAVKKINFMRPVINGVVQSQQLWYNESTPSSSPGGMKFYGSGASASISYWSYLVDFLVEWQMRSS